MRFSRLLCRQQSGSHADGTRFNCTPGYHGDHDNSLNRDTCQTNARGLNLLSVLKILISNCHMDIDIGVHIVLIL